MFKEILSLRQESTTKNVNAAMARKTEFPNFNAGGSVYSLLGCKVDVCLSVHRYICVEKKNQLEVTKWFITLIICSTCFGHFYAHHQELEAICVLLPPMVCDALVAGCRRSGAGQ